MAKIIKFIKKSFAKDFIEQVKPDKIAEFVQSDNPTMPNHIVDAMALAMIYTTYLQLLIDEDSGLSQDIVLNNKSFNNISDVKKTLH